MGKYTFEQLYFALENGFLNLSGGVPDPVDGSDIHQAFNPCHKDIEVPKPENKDKVEHTSDSVLPNYDVSYTEETTPGRGIFPNGEGMDYRDPFLKLCIFPHKTCTGTWGGGAGTYGQITGDFSAFDDISSIMTQYGLSDGVTPINRCLNGVRLIEYILGYKSNGILKEKVRLQSSFVSSNTQAFVPNANFDDGQWSLWALKGATQKIYPATGISVYWDDAHAAEFTGLEIQDFWMYIKAPRALEKTAKNLYYTEDWFQNCVFEATVKGILIGTTEFVELEKLFKNKVKKDLRMIWDKSANKNKYLEFDAAFINKLDSYVVPERGNVRKISMTLKGKSPIYQGNFENLPDPSSRIDLSP